MLPLLILLVAVTGCGGISTEQYRNKVWEIHQAAGDKLTVLFREINENTQSSNIKEMALQSLELSQEMKSIFEEALRELEGIKAPKEMAGLQGELEDYYREGVSLSAEFIEAYDDLYEISDTLEAFINQGLSILELDLTSASSSQIVSAIDQDVVSLKQLSQQIKTAAYGGGPLESFDTYLADLLDQLAGTLTRHRDAIQSNQKSARDELQSEVTTLLDGFDQQMGEGLPGLRELLNRRDELGIRGYELNDEINAL